MPTRIRLQRKGKKGQPYFHIVVADQRSPRDGRYIERIGAYDPTKVPAHVEVNNERALDWIQKGAQPSDTCRAIFSYTGLLYRNHLMGGVKKGAFSQEEADRRYEAWMVERNAKVDAQRSSVLEKSNKALRDRLEAETKQAQAMAEAIAAKRVVAVEAAPEVVPAASEEPAADAAPPAEA
jgi:small subunit ribosomal protein S16